MQIKYQPQTKDYYLLDEIVIAAPLERVFSFFCDPRNLETLTPPWLNFHITNVPVPEITEGTLLNYKLSLRGIPLRWQSIIELWQPNLCFSDRQLKGPYKKWYHVHTFQPQGLCTKMKDEVYFQMYGGPLSRLIAPWVCKDVSKVFDYRREQMQSIFASP